MVTDKQVHDYLNGYYNKGKVDEKVKKNIEGVGLGVMLGDKKSRMKYPEKSQKVKELEEINEKQDAEIKNLKDKVSLFEKENKEIKEMLMKLLEQKK